MLYKDACNKKSNQQNLGTIKCSNLCTEIVEFTSKDEVAVCNLASLVLPKFVVLNVSAHDENQFVDKFELYKSGKFVGYNHTRLYEIVKVVIRNLNKIIDVNHYPVEEAKNSNMRHRPIGIGVQVVFGPLYPALLISSSDIGACGRVSDVKATFR